MSERLWNTLVARADILIRALDGVHGYRIVATRRRRSCKCIEVELYNALTDDRLTMKIELTAGNDV